jgi:hypothetical protein
VSAKNLELLQYAFLKCNVISESDAPSPEQGVTGLNVLNDMMANMSKDGIKLGWYPQTDLSATAPLANEDVGPIKYMLCAALASHYGIELGQLLLAEIGQANTRLVKTALKYSEADLSELPRTQGLYNGGWY